MMKAINAQTSLLQELLKKGAPNPGDGVQHPLLGGLRDNQMMFKGAVASTGGRAQPNGPHSGSAFGPQPSSVTGKARSGTHASQSGPARHHMDAGDSSTSSSDSSASGQSGLWEQAIQKGADINGLVQLEMLKELKHMRRTRGKKTSSSSEASSGLGIRQAKGKLRGVQKLRRALRKKPQRVVKRYLMKVKGKLQALDDRKVWKLSDYSMRLISRFGKMKGLWRVHWLISETLQESLAGNHAFTQACLVQLLKGLHQVALDKGGWTTAQLLLPWEDPLAPDEFGGEPEELTVAHNYHSAMQELRKHRLGGGGAHHSSDEDPPGGGGPAPKKGDKHKKHGKDKDKDKGEVAG